MHKFQLSFFYDLQVFVQASDFHRKYYYLFTALDLSSLPDRNDGVGCHGHSRHAILRALLVKHLEGLKSIPRLLEFLDAHPVLTDMCGFQIGSFPDETQFYRFQQDYPHARLKDLHLQLNRILVERGIVALDQFAIDSKPVLAATKENNFKNPSRKTRNKGEKPKRNPQATLSYYSCQVVNGKKENLIFFWGYRTHVIVSKEGLCLVEVTLPNNQTDEQVAFRLLRQLKRLYKVKKGAIYLADKAYDARDLYTFIVKQMKGQPFIRLNPRNTQEDKTFGPHGGPVCEAGLEMKSVGTWTEQNRDRIKFRCPIKASKKFAADYSQGCPAHHTSFETGACYGCTKYLDVTDDARSRVPRDSKLFKETMKGRQVVEQYFARLGDREVEQTTHYALKSVRNQMTIAHIAHSLIAVAAAILLEAPEKIRCFRSFAQAQSLRRTA
jgi:hypothetical protein